MVGEGRMVGSVYFGSVTNQQCVCVHVCACVGGKPGRVYTCVHVWEVSQGMCVHVWEVSQGMCARVCMCGR